MARVTITDVGRRIDGLAATTATIDAKVDRVIERVDGVTGRVDGLTARVDGVTERVDVLTTVVEEHRRSTDEQFAQVQFAFGEMRTFVSESIGNLRTDMMSRFDRVDQRFKRVDRRFDRIEDKLDRALAPRPATPRRRRGR